MKPLSFFTALFVCLALLLASLYTVAIDPRTYARQQARLNVAERSGFSQEALLARMRPWPATCAARGRWTMPSFPRAKSRTCGTCAR